MQSSPFIAWKDVQRCLSLHHFRDRLDEAVSEIKTRMLLWVFKLQVSFKSYIQFPRRLRMKLMRNEYISAPWKKNCQRETSVCFELQILFSFFSVNSSSHCALSLYLYRMVFGVQQAFELTQVKSSNRQRTRRKKRQWWMSRVWHFSLSFSSARCVIFIRNSSPFHCQPWRFICLVVEAHKREAARRQRRWKSEVKSISLLS